MRRVVVATAVLVVLSGCSALPLGGGSAPKDVEYPPGAGPDGFETPSRLLDLPSEDRSYTLVVSKRESDDGQIRGVLEHEPGATLARMESNLSAVEYAGAGYVVRKNGTYWIHTRSTDGTDNRFESRNENQDVSGPKAARTGSGASVTYLVATESRRVLSAGQYSAVGTVEKGSTTLIKYRATSVDASKLGGPNVDSFRSTVFVSTRGVIRNMSYELSYTTDDGNEVEWTFRYEVVDVGETTVEKPAWRNSTVELSTDFRRNGTLAVLTNEGGATFEGHLSAYGSFLGPNNVVSDLRVRDLALERPLAPGDSLYLYVENDSSGTGTLRLARRPPDRLPSNATDLRKRATELRVVGTGVPNFIVRVPIERR